MSIAVGLRDPETNERVFARVKVPQILPRLLEVEAQKFVLIEQVIEANLQYLFTGMEVVDSHLFRVTRNADFTVEEDEADDLLMAIEEELRRRRFGEAVRLEVSARCRRRRAISCCAAWVSNPRTATRSPGCST
jgi:polyphosphate kinase